MRMNTSFSPALVLSISLRSLFDAKYSRFFSLIFFRVQLHTLATLLAASMQPNQLECYVQFIVASENDERLTMNSAKKAHTHTATARHCLRYYTLALRYA